MRIICDTNVLISGLLFGGNCRTIITLVSEGQIDGFTSVALLGELEHVLLRSKFGLSATQANAILDLVRQTFLSVSPADSGNVIVEDPDDDAVLQAAVGAHADVVVSGDDHLLKLGTLRGIRILSPACFLHEIRGQGI